MTERHDPVQVMAAEIRKTSWIDRGVTGDTPKEDKQCRWEAKRILRALAKAGYVIERADAPTIWRGE
jgi:hypothetical protein